MKISNDPLSVLGILTSRLLATLGPRVLPCFLLAMLFVLPATAADAPKSLPKEDVVDVPAIAKGLCVSNAFQTNMVLQRDKPLKIWGWADPGEKVSVSIAGQNVNATAAADRVWQVALGPMPANNTPQSMTVKGKSETLTLENILIGDVWILGGQSNMEFPISKVDDGDFEIMSANFPQLRLLSMPAGKGFDSVGSFERLHEWSDWSKRHFRKGDWDVCSPETVREFSAIGYTFGRRLAMATGVPIGLIDASIGGTTVETWTPEDVLRKIDGADIRNKMKDWDDKIASFNPQADLEQRIAKYDNNLEKMKAKGQARPKDLSPGPVADKNRPGARFASVIRPLKGLAAKGALFHQGFNNCFEGSAGARMYYQVFAKMIAAWRGNFDDEQMPFCIISLCTAGEPQTPRNFLKPMHDAGAYIREAQYKTFLDLHKAGDKTIGFISSFDQRKSFYHPQIKIPVGERAAKWALASQYGLYSGKGSENVWLPPAIEKVEIAGNQIQLTLSTEVKMPDESTDKMVGFAIAGDDRRFFPAEIRYFTDGKKDSSNRLQYDRKILVLSHPSVPHPAHYRYAWARNPMGNIVNKENVPLPAQRSDDWLLEETPVKFPLPASMAAAQATRVKNARISKELELDDTERRIQEAEATIAELKEPFLKAKAAWEQQKTADAEKLKAENDAAK